MRPEKNEGNPWQLEMAVQPTSLQSYDLAFVVLGIAAVVLLVLVIVVWIKGRPFAKGDVFRASRLSSGNRLFPTQVLISPTSVVHFTPEWFGRHEHSIHMAHVASVRIDTNLMFSDVYVETTGGSSAIRCHGHNKGDAVRMKQLIEGYQTDYYRADSTGSTGSGSMGSGSGTRSREPAKK